MSKLMKLLNSVNHDAERSKEEKELLEKVMLAKPRSIADRNREAAIKKKDAKENAANTLPSQNQNDRITLKEQLSNNQITPKELLNNNSITDKEQLDNSQTTHREQSNNIIVTPKDHTNNNKGTIKEHNSNSLISPKELLDNNLITDREQPDNTIITPKDHTNNTLVATKDQPYNNIVTPKEYINNNNITYSGQINNRQGAVKECINNSSITAKGRPEDAIMAPQAQDNNRTVTVTGQVDPESFFNDPNCVELTEIQMKIYNWFLRNGMTGYFNKVKLSKDTDIIHNTIRKVINKLSSSGLIFFGKYNDGTRLIPYKINNEKRAISCIVTGYGQDSNSNRTDSSSIIVSSKFLYKTNLLSAALKDNPDLAYWTGKLKVQKIESWMEELKISEEDMIESLCHCAFDMIEKKETDKKGQEIKNVLDWFYSIMKKYRYYDKPVGYKSFEEKAIERAEQRLKAKQERLNRINEIKKAERDADIDLKFTEVMQNPDGMEYKKCFDALNDMARRRNSGKMFEMSMRTKFIELFYSNDNSFELEN